MTTFSENNLFEVNIKQPTLLI